MKTHILIIGGDGDLAIRKLYRSLYSLEASGLLDSVSSVTGMGRTGMTTDAFRKQLEDRLGCGEEDAECWNHFREKLAFHTGDATQPQDLTAYTTLLGDDADCLDQQRLIIYLAIPPRIFRPACLAIKAAGLNGPFCRVVIEKPLGNSEATFLDVDRQFSAVFEPEQVFRIDHYLGKESVQNLIALRFANILFEPLWNSHYIDSVQITVAETVGVEDRKGFYDDIGALKDMVQNHLLQILCLVAMEPPVNQSAAMIQSEKLKVLQSLEPLTPATINDCVIRGQYGSGHIDNQSVESYLHDCGFDASGPVSTTETYIAIRARINSWRWSGVPFYLRTGKRLATRSSEILIQFKPLAHDIFTSRTQDVQANQMVIRLQPDSGIELHFQHKRPGFSQAHPLESVQLNLSAPEEAPRHTYDAYARLLLDVINDDQRLFVSAGEVQASWQWIDQISHSTAQAKTPLHDYAAGSMGPDQAIAMIARDHREWHELSNTHRIRATTS